MKTTIISNSIIRGLERDRLQLHNQHKQGQMFVLASIGGVVLLIVLFHQGMLSAYPLWMIILLGLIPLAGLVHGIRNWILAHRDYRKGIKSKAIRALFQNEDLDWTYSSNDYLPQRDFDSSKLFRLRPTSYGGKHLVTGTFEGIPFELSYLNCSRGSGKHRTIVFNGVLFRIKLPTQVNGTTVILPDTAQRVFGKAIGKKLQSWSSASNMQLVYFENQPEFEKKYVVYSSHEPSARKTLHPKALQDLVQLHQQYPSSLKFSVQQNGISVAISKMTLFKLGVHQALTEKDSWVHIAMNLKHIIKILTFFGIEFIEEK